jgi:CheY-like chemotaxis protein
LAVTGFVISTNENHRPLGLIEGAPPWCVELVACSCQTVALSARFTSYRGNNQEHDGTFDQERETTMGQKVEFSRVALIVEDDPEIRALATALLEETDLKVVEKASGEEALHYLHHHAGEVVFLFADVRLPCLMSGVDLARTVRLKWPWITIVLTSGAPLEDNLDKALRSVRFLPKPWRGLDVLLEAEKAVQTSRSEEASFRTHVEMVRAGQANLSDLNRQS